MPTMKLSPKLIVQATVFGALGGAAGYFVGPVLPKNVAAELMQALGNIGAIAGSLLGWSVGWLGQSRTLIKDIDYDAARQLFRDLGNMQRDLIWRWGFALAASIGTIGCAVILKTANLDPAPFRWLFTAAASLLTVSLVFVGYLFERMLALAALKSQLDEFEHDQLRKKRNTPAAE